MTSIGPVDPARSVAATQILPIALRAAEKAGVTRLADVTRLDRLGLPVWQAVRPMSRAVSVHQGKGATDADAKVGALLEGVESHAAETFEAAALSFTVWRKLGIVMAIFVPAPTKKAVR